MVSSNTRIHAELSVERSPMEEAHPEGQRCSADLVQMELSAELTERLRNLARQQGTTLPVALLSGWVVLLGRWTAQEEVLIGTRIASRQHTEIGPPVSVLDSTAVLPLRLQGDATTDQLLNQVTTTMAEACAREGVPFEQVLETLEPWRNHEPVFQVLMRLNGTPAAIIASSERQPPSQNQSQASFENAKTQLELSVSLSRGEESLTATLEYAGDLFERETVERMAACWQVLLEGMVADSGQLMSRLPMLTALERAQVLYAFNDTAVAYPQDRLLHELFEEQVRRTPYAVALVHEQQSLTYGDLNVRANQVARFLRGRGVGPDELVGIYVERSFEMVVGLLGILKAGGAYVPLDPAYPSERLAYMLKDAAPRVLLTQERLRSTLPASAAEVIAMDSRWTEIAKGESENLDPRSLQLTSRHLAYVIYTSGSTGEPKGVAGEHRGMVNRIAAQDSIGAISGYDICCQKTSIGFVDAIFEILGPLSYGRPLVLAPAIATRDVQELASLIEREHITRLVTVPSLAQSLLETVQSTESLRSLRSWTLSGEELKGQLLRKLHERLPKCTFTNLYGSSEVAADVTCYVSRNTEYARVPIGQPIANTQIYILDRHLQPLPIGVTGEIYIGGSGVARGYLNRPELTAERFIANPFRKDPRARLYKSGDLGRWRADGTIEYLGRNDSQVKIRGFRIELGEIEGQLARHGQVNQAAVVVREDAEGEKRLVAYITRRGESGPTLEDLRAHLKATLPEHMVPSAFVTLESLPLTPSGKLDRRALLAPELEAYVRRPYEAPQGEMEEILARIWQELLGVAPVGRRDNFFELGGHSLLIVQMMERLRQAGLSAEVGRIFASPTLADLASALTDEAVGQFEVPPNLIPARCEAITPQMLPLVKLDAEQIERIAESVPGGTSNIQDIYPLTPLQEGMLFHHLLDEQQSGGTYVLPMLLSLSSRERLEELVAALQEVIDRHDILRTAVLWEQLPQPLQVVYRQVTLPVDEIALDANRDPAEHTQDWIKPARQRMDLRRAPLMRLQVAADAQRGQWYALLQIHHIVDDDVSLKILISEVVAYLEGHATALPQAVPYRNYVAQALAHAQTGDAEAFFRSKLGGVDESTAPFELLDVHGDGSRIDEVRAELEPALAQRVRAQARRLAVSAATLFHAAWALVVARTSGRDDVVFGSVLLGRLQGSAGAQRIVGMFINTLPLRLRLQGVTARELVEQTQRGLVELLSHEQASLTLAQHCSGIVKPTPLFSAVLNYRHDAIDLETEWSNAGGIRLLASQERTNYPLTLSVDDLGGGFRLTAQTDRRIDPRRITEYVHTAMQSLVEALEQAPQTPALALSILPESERLQVIDLFNAAHATYPQEKLVYELFEEQVERTPNAIAVMYEELRLTYAELNGRANQVAQHLREKGVGPDQLVALCVERSLEMVVGVLGILKAGGAYVPLDPAYPSERLAYMLKDAAPKVLLIQERLRERLPPTTREVIALDKDWNEIAKKPNRNLDLRALGLRSNHMAYVIYTSGSTGEPKGVMVEHRNVTRLFAATEKWFGFNERDVWTLFHSFAFDFSVWELWGALLYGGRVVVVPYLTARAPQEFYRLLCEEGVTVLNQTPSAFAQLIDAQGQSARQHSLRVVIFGGEALELHMLRPWVKRNGAERPQLVNMYGITETTVHVTYRPLTQEEIESERGSPIGKPIPDLRAYLLDRHRQPLPVGVVGEMYIGGAGVARGYLNRPDLTAARFLRDPFNADPQARMYRTGDLGRWRMDGTIEYLGRNDHQVKIRGFRIELGEIEAQLVGHDQVKDAIVIAREDAPGEKRLVAYVIPDDPSGPAGVPSVETLRAHLKAVLPEHMVPSAFVMLERFPLTSNGKLDRIALPVPDERAVPMGQYVAPRNELERKLCEVWEQVLGLGRVGVEDNFFALGGDSILTLRVLARTQVLGMTLGVTELFRNQSIAQLARAIETGEQSSSPSKRVAAFELLNPAERAQFAGVADIADAYPLSLLQEGMYFHSELATDSAIYHEIFSYRIEAAFHREHFEHVVRGLAQRHPVLRTGFVMSCDHRLVQIVHENVAFRLQVEDISQLSPTEQDRYIQGWIGREKYQRFVWSEPPLLRIFVHVRAQNYFQYSLSFHHAILDGWSVASLQTELINHYSSLIEGREQVIDAPRVMYRDFIARERCALQSTRSHEYWRELLEGVDLPSLPKAADPRRKNRGHEVATCRLSFGSMTSRGLQTCAQQLGVHLKLLLLAAHVKVMSVIGGQQTVLTGLVSHGRLEDEDGERVLGLHLNSLPVRVDVLEDSWRELVMRLRDLEEAMLPHRLYPLAAIQELLHSDQLFDTLFNFTRFHVYRQVAKAVNVSEAEGFEQTNFSLLADFSQELNGPNVSLSINFDPAVFDRIQIERMGGYYERALRRIVDDIDARHDEETLLGEAERDELLVKFNGTASAYPSDQLIPELFEEQVLRTPAAIAVEYEGRSLTYAELNGRANQLARYLRDRGVGPDQLVGICVERGLEMVVGLLGILKAGGAYVPLDPNYPIERLHYMLEDAAPLVVLTQESLKKMLPTTQAEVVLLDAQSKKIAGYAEENLPVAGLGLAAQNLVYVIYTSGSTGRPKGTAMGHRSMVNLIEWHRKSFGTGEVRRVLQFAALSFDVAFQETFSTLCTGSTLVLLDEWTRRDARALAEFLSSRSIHRLFVPPLMLQSLAESLKSAGAVPVSLRDVITAGEQLRISPEISSLFKQLNGCQLHNHYGPTETHVVTALTLTGDPGEWPVLPAIGQPISNVQMYVLDGQRQPVPIGVTGEIYIGGAGVARGYLNRPQQTAERFIADPFSADPQARLYKTGDLGRWRADGTLEYLGRNDDQVKIRGYRIELGEVEAQLERHEQVKEAAVVAREDIAGEKRLVAYVALRDPSSPNVEELRAHLKAVLPEYMVPSAIVVLERLPLTPSGKLNRRVLPPPEFGAYVSREYEAPQGEVEESLAEIWQELLRIGRVGRQDNFFELGGHSLHGMKLVARIAERFMVRLAVIAVFQYQTIQQMAEAVESLRSVQGAPLNSDGMDFEEGVI